MKLSEVYRQFVSKQSEFAVPTDFFRFYLTLLVLEMNETVDAVKVTYQLTNTLDVDKYVEAVNKLVDVYSLTKKIVHNAVTQEEAERVEEFLRKVRENELVDVDELFTVKEILVNALFEKGLINVFQLSVDDTIVDNELTEVVGDE